MSTPIQKITCALYSILYLNLPVKYRSINVIKKISCHYVQLDINCYFKSPIQRRREVSQLRLAMRQHAMSHVPENLSAFEEILGPRQRGVGGER
jgi:hypothetical protein